jgi:hypothetical protein
MAGLDDWKRKVRKRCEASYGGGTLAEYAVSVLDTLDAASSGRVRGDFKQLSKAFGIPLKFLLRSLTSAMGVVRIDTAAADQVTVWLQHEKVSKSKASAGMKRTPLSKELRQHMYQADGYRCARCKKKSNSLQIDHIIPLSMLGADEPGNWVCLCKPCNREKWQHVQQGFLKRYRGEAVVGRVGARLHEGRLWPRINGRMRTMTRAEMLKQRSRAEPPQ